MKFWHTKQTTLPTQSSGSTGGAEWKPCTHPPLKIFEGELWGLPGSEHKNRRDEFDLSMFMVDLYLPFGFYGDGIAFKRDKPIIYFPVDDMKAPPKEPLTLVIHTLTQYLKKGKKVAISCQGGHGRTGTILALMWGLSHPSDKDPVGSIRALGCEKWAESREQINFIHEYLKLEVPEHLKPSKGAVVYGQNISQWNDAEWEAYRKSLKEDNEAWRYWG